MVDTPEEKPCIHCEINLLLGRICADHEYTFSEIADALATVLAEFVVVNGEYLTREAASLDYAARVGLAFRAAAKLRDEEHPVADNLPSEPPLPSDTRH